ncbi:PREDICTED: uncharacterized protein LOC109585121 [Amphimedon queenslandica]|uniref:Uncharacterized protein n=1 Tax=Amphimedon queenslandica TaxID=400682 RepID=A0AAN0JI29_AMPQE|nr:PREDICTED: uncharacterized protein LOC109585121 [Amphimedon queenslandica]|eukprot:XP_019856634.1 PREDICTED: uncharacterized protein LOC109585121 [Amphimedon queenslandica]
MPKLTLSNGQYMAVNSDNSNDVLVWCLTDLMKTKSPDPHVTIHRQSTGPLVWFNTDTLMTAASTGFIPMLPGWVPGFRRMNYQSLTGEIELWNVGKHYKDSKKPTSNVYKVSHMYMPNSSMKLSSSVAGPVTQLVLMNGRILTTSGTTLSVVDASNGDTVESFTDHKDTITDIYADSYRVLTCSKDYSIRVYRWSNNTLLSLYQLLGGSIAHKTHDGFHKVLCSSGTCIGVAGNIIKLYNFNENIKSS